MYTQLSLYMTMSLYHCIYMYPYTYSIYMCRNSTCIYIPSYQCATAFEVGAKICFCAAIKDSWRRHL